MSIVTLPNPKYILKPYEKMFYPGQRVQIDINTFFHHVLLGIPKKISSINTPQ